MFEIIVYQAQKEDSEHQQYNGKLAIVLPWSPDHDQPQMSRWVTIMPYTPDNFPRVIPVIEDRQRPYSTTVSGNVIRFECSGWSTGILVDTTSMVKFTETHPISKPVSKWTKHRERKTYKWVWGRWIHIGWEQRPDEE